MEEKEKRCTGCGEVKPVSEFYKRGHNRRARCKSCVNAQTRRYAARNSGRIAIIGRRKSYKRLYGITLEDYDRLLESQGGRCAICRCEPTKGRRLSVDHCHETNRVRGLLCYRCNSALGALGDTTESIARVLRYTESAAACTL